MELIRKDLDFDIRQAGDPEDRTLEFIGSTGHVDRYGDVIEVAGWDLKNYQKNPVFLWAHDYRQPPVGKALKVEKTDQGLLFRIQFPTAEEYPFADTVYKLYLGGYLRATSVGFQDLEREPLTDKEGKQTGFRYKKQELYELSAVPVPANPQALIMAVQKGVVSPEEMARLSGVPCEEGPGREDSTEAAPEITEPAEPDGKDSEMSLPAAGLMEDLKVTIDELATRVAELRPPQVDPAQLKAVIRETLEEFFTSGEKASDYYSLALNPGLEPDGGRPAGETDINELLASTQKLHRTVRGGINHGS
jgi:uncharacterized protein